MFNDTDWAVDVNDRIPTTDNLQFLGQNPINQSSKKQTTIAQSSTEYLAIASALSETIWIKNLLFELGIPLPKLQLIYCDNNIEITYLCKNPVFHSHMKHLTVDFHYVRGQIKCQFLTVAHIHATNHLADSLTKALPPHHHIPKLAVPLCLTLDKERGALKVFSLSMLELLFNYFVSLISSSFGHEGDFVVELSKRRQCAICEQFHILPQS